MSAPVSSSSAPSTVADSILDFYATTPAPSSLPKIESAVQAFQSTVPPSSPIVLITSGGTLVPLEQNMVRFIDNFSTGTRGAALAEGFLQRGYHVLFLHRTGSAVPFLRRLATVLARESGSASSGGLNSFSSLDALKVTENGVSFDLKQNGSNRAVLSAFSSYHSLRSRLLPLEFQSISDYLHSLRSICIALRPLEKRAAVFFAAAVSDYYIPLSQLSVHKLDSRAGTGLELRMEQTPKVLTAVRNDLRSGSAGGDTGKEEKAWLPHAFLVSFKLETDTDLLLSKSLAAIQSYDVNAVLANELHSRYERIKIIRRKEGAASEQVTREQQADVEVVERARPPSSIATSDFDEFAFELEVKLVDRLVRNASRMEEEEAEVATSYKIYMLIQSA